MQSPTTCSSNHGVRANARITRIALAVLLPIVLLIMLPVAAFAAEYTVQRGDTLWRLAIRYNTTVTAIVRANNIANPNLIRVGQRLFIPTGTSSTTTTRTLASPVTATWANLSNVRSLPSTTYNAIHRWDEMTNYYARYYRVDPDLIRRIMHVESRGYQYARNASSGAAGLMQVMPFWFKSGENMYDPWTNIGRGTYILRWNYDRFGTWDKAVAAYLGGITRSGTITSSGYNYLSLVFNR